MHRQMALINKPQKQSMLCWSTLADKLPRLSQQTPDCHIIAPPPNNLGLTLEYKATVDMYLILQGY